MVLFNSGGEEFFAKKMLVLPDYFSLISAAVFWPFCGIFIMHQQ
jgi:hypothetical protein